MGKQKQSVSDQVYEQIKDKITRQEFFPGEHLVEADLIQVCRCSRATLRGALRRLAEEGFTEYVPNKGVRVKKLSQSELLDVERVVQALEVLAAQLAARFCGSQELEKLQTALERYEEAINGQDASGVGSRAVQFHLCLANASGNTYLSKIVEQQYAMLMTNSRLASVPIWTGAEQDAHLWYLENYKQLLMAITEHDVELAGQLVYAQLQRGIEKLGAADGP